MMHLKKALGISIFGQYIELVINFVTVLILSRILTPSDIGIYSVAAFLGALLHILRDFGVNQYIAQEKNLTKENIRSAIGLAVVLAILISVFLLIASKPFANFYGTPEVEIILYIMAASFLISPFGAITSALLRREMEFKKIFIIRIGSTLCNVATSLIFAMLGYGAVSLALANLSSILSVGAFATLLRPSGTPWLPRFNGMRSMISFGKHAILGNIATTGGTNAPDLIVGKLLDLSAVGYLSRANGIVQLSNRLLTDGVAPLILPYFSKIRRDGSELCKPYLAAISLLTGLTFPFFLVIMVLAEPLIYVLYGSQWAESVPIVKFLCCAGIISSITIFGSHVMIADGQVRNASRAQIVALPFRLIFISLACLFELSYVGIAIIISEIINFMIISHYIRKTIDADISKIIVACWKSLFICLFTIGALMSALSCSRFFDADATGILLIGGVSAIIGWLLGIVTIRHPLLAHLTSLVNTIRIRFA